MNMKRARFWRNLLLCSAMTSAATWQPVFAQQGTSRVGDGSRGAGFPQAGQSNVPESPGFAPVSPSSNRQSYRDPSGAMTTSPYMPSLDAGYNFNRPMPPSLPPSYDTLQNARRDAMGPRFDFGTILNNQLGVNNGSVNFNALVPIFAGDNDVWFVDGRGVATYAGQGAASAGLGFRHYSESNNRIWGLSGWGDIDDGHSRTFTQAGISLESLGVYTDVRINGYLPFGEKNNIASQSFVGNPFFGGNNLLVNQRTALESALHGFDAEMGGPLPGLGRYGVNGYLGGYWLNSNTDKSIVGPRVRMDANVTDGFQVGVTVSNDSVFGTNAWVNFNMTLPDGRARRWFRPTAVEDRMLSTVNRSYRVQTHTKVDIDPVPVHLAGPGGRAVSVVFVDPDRLINGTGTFENPLKSLQGFTNVPSNVLIIVDGSATGNMVPTNGNLRLFDDQKLLSTFALAGGIALDTNLGTITLPAINFGDRTPDQPHLFSPMGGTLVTLAGNNTEVAGFVFEGATGNPAIPNSIAMAGSNINNFNIHHNTFQNYRDGVTLTNATGVGRVEANVFSGLAGTSTDGFRVLNNVPNSTLNLLMDRYVDPGLTVRSQTTTTATTVATTITKLREDANTITGNDGAGVRITARNKATINAHIVDNTEDRNGNGLLDLTEDVNGNGVLDTGEDLNSNNVLDLAEDTNANGVIDGISNNGDGIVLEAMSGRAVINAGIANNLISGNRGEDRNKNGILDPGEDLDGDGLLNRGRGIVLASNVTSTINANILGEDVNANGRLDRSEDLNNNKVLDTEDVNGNGVLDTEDTNGNGVLDPTEDTNGNGLLDAGEDTDGDNVLDRAEDANSNGRIDTEDKNGNGRIDTEDKNGNGKLDKSEDTNGNGLLDGGYLITGNTITNNTGDGIAVTSHNLSNVNLLMTRNNIGSLLVGSGNGGRGLSIIADSGFINANIGFLRHEDLNFDGVLQTEDTNGNGKLDFGEDKNGNGQLDLGEDTNGNHLLDVANPLDGNNFVGNLGGGVVVDLSGTAVGNIQAFNNNVLGASGGSLTFSATGNPLTPSYTVANTSPRGVFLNQFSLDLATAQPLGLEFDPVATPFSASTAGQTATGLIAVNGSTTTPFTVAATTTNLDLSFNSFDSQSALPFSLGISQVGGGAVSGDQLIGSTVSGIFSTNATVTAANASQARSLSGTMVATLGDPTGATINLSPGINAAATGTGIDLRASGAAVFNNTLLVGNDVRWYSGSGISAKAIEDGQFNNLQIRNNNLDTNTSGISLNTQFAATASINATVVGNTIRNNTEAGLSATADSGQIRLREIDLNTITGNRDGISLNTVNNGLIDTRITSNTISGSTRDGIAAVADTGQITINQFTNNSVTGSGANGLRLEGRNNSGASLGGVIQIANTEDVNGNGVLDLGEDANNNGLLDLGFGGKSEDLNGNAMLDTGEDLNNNQRLDLGNVFSGNAGNAIFVTGTGEFDLGTIRDANITQGGGGIIMDVTDSVLTGRFIGNTIDGSTATGASGPGLSLTATNGTFNVVVGGPLATDRNTFRSNAGAGISILAQDAALGTFRIENNLITGTANESEDRDGNGTLDPGEDRNGNGVIDTDNTLTPFAGHGIYVGTRTAGLMDATATFNNSVILNNVIGDETTATLGTFAGGILVQTGQQSTINGLNIQGNLIANSGQTTTPLDSFDNTLAGITFERSGDAALNNITLLNNRILNNVFDGIYLHARGGNLDQLDFTIQGNTISGNNTVLVADPTNIRSGTAGIHLRGEGDVLLQTDIRDNVIENNRNGIRLSSFEATNDTGSQTGTWTKNTIRNNTEHGIAIFAVTGQTNSNPLLGQNPLRIGLNGNDPADNRTLGNLITGNGQGGIEINLGGNIEIVNNQITLNGLTAGSDANGTGGIDINLLPPVAGAGTDTTHALKGLIFNNKIQNNTGDGIELAVSRLATTPGTIVFDRDELRILGNSILNNTARGIDVLNQGDGNLQLTIGDLTALGGNEVSNSGQEGVYIVNTSSLTQSQQNSATVALTTGAALASPIMVVDVRGNSVRGNNGIGFPTSPILSSFFQGAGVVFRSGNSTGGDFIGRISENTFSGNTGDDVLLQTFVSNTNVAATAAPLGMVFQNNVGVKLDVNTLVGGNARIELPFNNNTFQTIADPNTIFTTPPWVQVAPGTFSPLFP